MLLLYGNFSNILQLIRIMIHLEINYDLRFYNKEDLIEKQNITKINTKILKLNTKDKLIYK